jgi:hypothetical protein
MKNASLKNRIIILITTLITALVFIFLGFAKNENKIVKSHKINTLEIKSPSIPSELYLFGERIPLESFDILERFEREIIVNTFSHAATILSIKRSGRWFPIIEEILKKNNVPEDFKYLAVVESNLDNVVSPAGATGFWQFMKETAIKYGLEVNDQVDERYHIEKSTQAACEYLLEAYNKFGNWTLAAASYNAGMNGIKKWSGIQRSKNFYNLLLNTETSRFIFRIAAIKTIFENPENYGFIIDKSEKYAPIKTSEIKIDSSISNLTDFSISLGINYKILKYLNPWLRDTQLKNTNNKSYIIKIPEKNNMLIFPEF